MMRQRTRAEWRRGGLLCLLMVMVSAFGCAQNPSGRPNILWHLGTFAYRFNYEYPPTDSSYLSFTEDGEYFAQGYGHLQVYKTDWAKDPSVPRGRGLVSYQLNFGTNSSFTDRDENNREYIVRAGRIAEWVRNTGAYGGGYLKPAVGFSTPNATMWMPLRGNITDRRLNRLFAVGQSNGQITLVLLDYDTPNNMNTNRVSVPAHAGAVRALAYDPASRVLFTGGADGLIRSWSVGLNGNTPTLSPRQTIAAHLSSVIGLDYASEYLLSAGSSEHVIKGWQVNGGNLSATPVWHTELPFTYIHNTYHIVPTGHPKIASVFMYDYRAYGASSRYLFIERKTGRVLSEWLCGASGYPVFNVAKGIWVLNQWLIARTAGVPQAVSISSLASGYPVTALAAVGNAAVAGYTNGELRSYNPNGSNTTAHPNRRVIGLADVSVSGAPSVLSADVEGRIVISPVPIGTPRLVLPPGSSGTGLDSAVSVAVGADATSQLVALAGQAGGQAQVRVFRLTWNGSTPALSLLASFNVSNSDLSRLQVRFVAGTSADLVVLSGAHLSRWTLNGSSYQQLWGVNLDDLTSTMAVTQNRVWVRQQGGYFGLYDVQNGSRLMAQNVLSYGAPPEPLLAHRLGSDDVLVYADSISDSLQDSPFVVEIAQEIQGNDLDNPWLSSQLMVGLRVYVSDRPTAVAALGSGYLVGCRDGQVYAVVYPFSPRMHPFAYNVGYNGFGAYFGQVSDRLLFTAPSSRPHPVSDGYSLRQLKLWSVSTGMPIFETRLCSPTDCVAGTNYNFTRPAPSNNYLYTFETNYSFARLTVWGNLQGTPSQLYYLTETSGNQYIFRQWWMVPVDDQRVGFIYAWPVGQPFSNNTQFFEARLRFFQWQPSPQKVDVALPLSTMRLYDNASYYCMDSQGNPTCPLWSQVPGQMRWDLNANRRVAAVLGVHRPDPNNPSTAQWRVALLYRPDPNDWSNWQPGSTLTQGVDFPAGVSPTMVRFHPTNPSLLYVGLSNGKVRIYVHNNGAIQSFTELSPTQGNPGSVVALDVAKFRNATGENTVLVFGGVYGLSVFTAPECAPDQFSEIAFYNIDIGFEGGTAHIQLSQPSPNADVVMVYGSRLTLSAATLPNLPTYPCAPDPCSETHCTNGVSWTTGDVAPYPNDPNNSSINDFGDCCVDDADLLAVLFAFGSQYDYQTQFKPGPGDANCDGIVDDADLLIVLFSFGLGCN